MAYSFNDQEERIFAMTYRNEDSTLSAAMEFLTSTNPDRFRLSLESLLNAVMLLERQEHLRAAPFERSAERNGHANGFKDKSFASRLGELSLKVPQVRGSEESFYPKCLDKGLRSERALKLALAEMYVNGVSTRKVAKITEELCGLTLTSTQVSRAAAELDEQLSAWRDRPLSETPYLVLDARYEKVRQGGLVQDAAVLVAMGIDTDGKRDILGVSIALSEHEAHWRVFLQSLVARGLTGVRQITSDNHAGIKAARQAVFGGVPWQRCQFHLQQNASAYVPRQEMKVPVAADIRAIFTAPDQIRAQELLKETVARYAKEAPKLASWMESALPEGLTVLALPEGHRRLLRTSNGIERVNKEIKRRTRVATLFPSTQSCLRLVSAVLMEIAEEWQAGKTYLTFAKPTIS